MKSSKSLLLRYIGCAFIGVFLGVSLWYTIVNDTIDEPDPIVVTLANIHIEIQCANSDLVSKGTGEDMLEYANGYLEGWHNYSISHAYRVTIHIEPELKVIQKEPSFSDLYEDDMAEPNPRSMGYYREGYYAGRAHAKERLKSQAQHIQSSMREAPGP